MQDRRTSPSMAKLEAAAATSAAAVPEAAPALRPNIVTSWARTTTADASEAAVPSNHGQAKAGPVTAAPWPTPSAAQLRKVRVLSLRHRQPSCMTVILDPNVNPTPTLISMLYNNHPSLELGSCLRSCI